MLRIHTKVWLMLFVTMLIVLISGYAIGHRVGLMLAFLVYLVFSLLILTLGEAPLLKKLKGHELKGQDPYGVRDIINELKESFYLSEDVLTFEVPYDTINVGFFFTQNYQPSLIMTRGFLDRTSLSEKRVLLAMALAQVKHRYALPWLSATFLVNGALSLADWIDSFFPENLNLFRFFMAPLGKLILSFFGYQRVCILTDRKALEVVPLPEVMGPCLENYSHMNQVNPIPLPPCTSHLFLFSKDTTFFGTHPPIKRRCNQVLGSYPI